MEGRSGHSQPIADTRPEPGQITADELALLRELRRQPKGAELARRLARHPLWGEINIVVKRGEFVMVSVREDTKLSDARD